MRSSASSERTGGCKSTGGIDRRGLLHDSHEIIGEIRARVAQSDGVSLRLWDSTISASE
jgi:hypothetical protein